MARNDVAFDAEGTTLRGWLYRPDDAGDEALPVVVMAHGWSAVKEMYLDQFARVFTAAGLAVLVFDNRNFGASDGQPRYEIDPWAQVRDYRHAITNVCAMRGIDRERIGVWGVSYSGGHALVVAAVDKRVRCVVAQTPTVSGWRGLQALARADFVPDLYAALEADRDARLAGAAPASIPVVSEDPLGSASLQSADAWRWFSETGRTRAPAWRNEITLRSLDMLMEYEPVAYIDRIAPTPLCMLVAHSDVVTPTDLALAAYRRAFHPKRLVLLPGGHFDGYEGEGFDVASAAARDWFVESLGSWVR